jgi:hypothetical protein
MIDGDHSYEGVRQDWLDYGPLGKMVAFHDIDARLHKNNHTVIQVPRFWDELKGAYEHVELVSKRRGLGIGVLFQ